MKMKMSMPQCCHAFAIVLLVTLTGCAAGQPAAPVTPIQNSTTASPSYEQLQEQAQQATAMRAESVHQHAETLLKRGLDHIDGTDNEVSRDGDLIDAYVWMPNGAAICEIANDTDDMRGAWIDLRSALIQIVDGAMDYAETSDFPVYVNLYFVDENDHGNHLMTITDGICVQDTSGIEP